MARSKGYTKKAKRGRKAVKRKPAKARARRMVIGDD